MSDPDKLDQARHDIRDIYQIPAVARVLRDAQPGMERYAVVVAFASAEDPLASLLLDGIPPLQQHEIIEELRQQFPGWKYRAASFSHVAMRFVRALAGTEREAPVGGDALGVAVRSLRAICRTTDLWSAYLRDKEEAQRKSVEETKAAISAIGRGSLVAPP